MTDNNYRGPRARRNYQMLSLNAARALWRWPEIKRSAAIERRGLQQLAGKRVLISPRQYMKVKLRLGMHSFHVPSWRKEFG